ncbi:chain A iron Centre cytochrome C protein [Caldimicrobium thiodismutans]|jgi:hypothetical protein|uniref:Chain A iron Centre cytochrome C protein n=1 Tax=Caldimicrobium thiodismutans TaxID=1653476 RepID=A0A0U5AFU7_9BACT|nr:C-GCAxxG-C-C family protein [Caldimicrobium thiodismutans]BAU22876.1 chain A iron Centre cytochrome C protein [Caldimicrobium thiodismutans]
MGDVSRRDFLIGSGLFSAGLLLSKAFQIDLVTSAEAKMKTQKWPWPYEKLDPEKTAEIAYNEWYRVFCGAAVISSIFSQLAEKIGEPYASFPVDAFIIQEGGLAGWGTLCGSINGAAVVANCICGPRISGSEVGHIISTNLLDWYSNTDLPTYKPKNPKANKERIVQTMSGSPLCHISVGKWMKASGFALASPERKDRCARVAASVAYQLTMMLNAWKDGKFHEGVKWSPAGTFGITAQQNCGECHGSNIPEAPKMKK